MGDVIPFKRPSSAQKSKGKTLCKSGFHRWQVLQDKQFDVRQGRLVTLYQCERCGARKTEVR